MFDLLEIYNILHLITAECLPLKAFQEHTVDYILENKTSLNQFEGCNHIKNNCISDYISIMLEINLKRQLETGLWWHSG